MCFHVTGIYTEVINGSIHKMLVLRPEFFHYFFFRFGGGGGGGGGCDWTGKKHQ